MDAALRLLLTNAATAGLVAALAGLASRVVRRPAIVHGLWLLALVKLVTPPVLPLPVLPLLPRAAGLSVLATPRTPVVVPMAPEPRPTASAGGPRVTRPAPTPADTQALASPSPVMGPAGGLALPAPARLWSRAKALVRTTLGVGALAVLLLAGWRFFRFRRLLACGEPAPAAVDERAAFLAARLGLKRVPPILVVPARIPPMLWPEPGGPRLLLPRDLLPELGEQERDTLLAHELAHLHRRDHWVRLVEMLATALFWWYPVTWWARKALRRAEERCCDEWVLRVLPRSAEAYAQGLLKSLTFVSCASAEVPALASGASPLHDLEVRLKEILMSRPAPHLAAPFRLALAALAALGLAAFPTRARTAGPDEPAPAAAAVAATAPATAVQATPAPSGRARPALASARGVQGATEAERQNEAEQRELEPKRRALDAQRRQLQQQELDLSRQELELRERAEQAREQAEQQLEQKQRAIELQEAAVEKQVQALAAQEQISHVREATQELARSLAEQAASLKQALQETGAPPEEIEREIRRLQAAIDALRADARATPLPRMTPRPEPKPKP